MLEGYAGGIVCIPMRELNFCHPFSHYWMITIGIRFVLVRLNWPASHISVGFGEPLPISSQYSYQMHVTNLKPLLEPLPILFFEPFLSAALWAAA